MSKLNIVSNDALLLGTDGIPRSAVFGDVYFSREDGVAESQYVFIEGNKLPTRFAASQSKIMRIVEVGFGSGLNCINTLYNWQKYAQDHSALEYIAIEGFPLSRAQIEQILGPWPQLAQQLKVLLAAYPSVLKGRYKLFLQPNFILTLLFEDISRAVEYIPEGIDAWYLDGFAPQKNPAMWQAWLFQLMYVKSREAATLATFTAAGQVRRDLQAAGFMVEKRAGFGHKRESLVGSKPAMARAQDRDAHIQHVPKTAIVIGAGIAGCTVAYELAIAGFKVTVLEVGDVVATGASGNDVGILYPRMEAGWSEPMIFYLQAMDATLNLFDRLSWSGHEGLWENCGVLQLPKQEDDCKRFVKIADLIRDPKIAAVLEVEAIKKVAGVPIKADCALWIPRAGYVKPRALCKALLTHPDINTLCQHEVKQLGMIPGGWRVGYRRCRDDIEGYHDASVVVVANSYTATRLEQLAYLEHNLQKVRGQISVIPQSPASGALKIVLCGSGGYVTPQVAGQHYVGANYVYNDASLEPDVASHLHNLQIWSAYFPTEPVPDVQALAGRASIRCVSKDRMPIIGSVPHCPGLYVSVAHGSRGMLSSSLAAQKIVKMMT